MENMVANEEVVENVVEEVVETTKPKFSFGKALGFSVLVAGITAGVVYVAKKIKAKKQAVEEKEVETADSNWAEQLEETAAQMSKDDLD